MKFCKVLEGQDKDFPELNHMFLRYKELKKKIKTCASKSDDRAANASTPAPEEAVEATAAPAGPGALSPEEQEFISALNEDLDRFNAFFMEKEEEAVIKLQVGADQLRHATTPEALSRAKGDLVNLHGELVIILHWSLINYSAIVKILKKHDKRTGVLLRAPYLANVLQQPFSSTNVMSRLVKRAEELVQSVELTSQASTRAASGTGNGIAGSNPQEPPSVQPHGQQQPAAGAEAGGGAGAAAAAIAAALAAAGGPCAPQAQQQRGSSDDETSSLTEGPHEHPEAPQAKRTKLALEMWASLAKTASTPSTIMPTSEAASKPPGASLGGSDNGPGRMAA